MGNFFSNILVENAGSSDRLQEGIVKALDRLGFVPAGDGADFVVSVYCSPGDRFAVLVGEGMEGDLDELAKGVAVALKCRTIAVKAIDSDVLLLSLTKGRGLSTVCVGDALAYGIEPAPMRAAPWKELVGAHNWDAFLAAIHKERVFPEDALGDLAPLIGFDAADGARHGDDPGEPRFACAFARKAVVPWDLPADLPPALKRSGQPFAANPINASFVPSGGQGTGLEISVAANEFDADQCVLRGLRVQWDRQLDKGGRGVGFCQETHLEAQRATFQDGRNGWVARFPDFAISPGVNEKHPDFFSKKGMERHYRGVFVVSFAIEGDGFPAPDSGGPDFERGPKGKTVDLTVVPMQNRQGASAMRIGVTRLG